MCEIGLQTQHTNADSVNGVRQRAAAMLTVLHQAIPGQSVSADMH